MDYHTIDTRADLRIRASLAQRDSSSSLTADSAVQTKAGNEDYLRFSANVIKLKRRLAAAAATAAVASEASLLTRFHMPFAFFRACVSASEGANDRAFLMNLERVSND